MNLTLWRDDVTLARAVRAAEQRHAQRSRLYVRIEHDGVSGFGEVAPQPWALNGDPSLDDVLEELTQIAVPQLLGVVAREHEPPSWTRVARFAGGRSASPVAVALLEMALLDRELRAHSADALSLWPRHFNTPVQNTVSLLDEEPWVLSDDVARVRAKTAPGPLSTWSLERLGDLTVPVLLDFNCSVSEDNQVLEQVAQLSEFVTLDAVEQPYAEGNLIDHATLAEQLAVDVSLDEGVRNLRDLEQIHRYHAARMVCIKPARVGGLANARAMVTRALELGLRPYIGGFFESPFARHVNRLLAEHCVEEPSDVGLVATNASPELREVTVVPGGLGLAPSPGVLARSQLLATW
jgi:O-succinylbenzoate synthase